MKMSKKTRLEKSSNRVFLIFNYNIIIKNQLEYLYHFSPLRTNPTPLL